MTVAALASALLLASLGQWPPPPEAFDAGPEVFLDPSRQPNDPAFQVCLNPLLDGRPPCAGSLPEEEGAAGVGVGVDRAWALTRGEVTIAVVGDGAPLDDPETGPQIRLNAGELPVPEIPGVFTHDANGDGRFDLRDYTTATGTAAPTVDRISDATLRARPDGGDVNGNGRLDPSDLIAVFGQDGVDDDENGFVDDVAGWDFVDGDNDPSAPLAADEAGRDEARRLVATANDGVGSIGVCPECQLVVLRVGRAEIGTGETSGPIRASHAALAMAYAAAVDARVAALLGDAESVPRARSERLLLVQALGGQAARPIHDGVLMVEALGARTGRGGELSTVFDRPRDAAESPFGAPDYAGGPMTPALLTAGGAALLASLPGAPASAAELRSLLVASAVEVDGVRRLDVAAAMARLRSAGAAASFVAPRPLAVLSSERPVTVEARGDAASMEIDWGPRARPPRRTRAEVVGPGRFRVDPGGRYPDPLAPPRPTRDAVVELRLLGPDDTVLDRRPVFFQRAPELLPAFPIELGEGVEAAPRVDARGRIWIAGLDGHIFRVTGRGDVLTTTTALGPVRAPLSLDSEDRPWMTDEDGHVLRLTSEGPSNRFRAGSDPGPAVQLQATGPSGPQTWVRSEGALSADGRRVDSLPGRGPITAFDRTLWIGTNEGVHRFDVESSGHRRLFPSGPISWLVTGLNASEGLAAVRAFDGNPPRLLRFDLEDGGSEQLPELRPAAPFAVTSVDPRGGLEVVGVDDVARIYAFDLRRAEMVPGFPVPLPYEPVMPLFPLDLDGDARAELIHAAQPYALGAIGRAGTEVPSFPRLTGDEVRASPVAGDLDGDGRAELIAVTRSGRVFAWRGRGDPPRQWTGAHRDDGATLDLRNGLSGRPRDDGGCRGVPSSPLVLALLLSMKRRRARRP